MAVIDSPIICTCSFRDETKKIFGRFSQRDEEFCALAYAIAGTGIFYRCCELTKVDIKREKSAVHLQMTRRQYRDEIRPEMKLRSWKARPVLIHSHPHDPHAAIAVGAAVFAAQIAWGEGGDLEMKAGASYGIKTVRDENGTDVYHITNLIMVGDVLPKSVKEPFRTYRDDQRTVDIELYSNEHADEEVEVSECTEIVNPESNLMDLGRATKKGTAIQVSMELDKSGVLTLIAESEFGYYKRVAHITNSMSDEDVEKAKRQLAAGTVQ